MRKKTTFEIGEVYGRMKIVSKKIERRPSLRVLCQCTCGVTKYAPLWNLRKGLVKSCGCLLKESGKRLITHGMTGTKIFKIWDGMNERCNRKGAGNYRNYGGRGIRVCKEWSKFENFFADMGPSYKEGLSLDRVNNEGNYEPPNCRWTTRAVQSRNRRDNVKYKGEVAADASIRLGGNSRLVYGRLKKGWPIEKAFTEPADKDYAHPPKSRTRKPSL